MATIGRFGKCCCAKCVAKNTVDKWLNKTTVADFAVSAGPPIPPYPRLNGSPGTTCAADLVSDLCPPGPGEGQCDLPKRSDLPKAADCEGYWQDWNCYVLDTVGGTALSNTIKGHVKVQGQKQWHGRKPWKGDAVCASGCPSETVRYRTVERSFRVLDGSTWVWHDHSPTTPPYNYDWQWNVGGGEKRVFTVAKDSGVVTLDECGSDYSELRVTQPSPPFPDLDPYYFDPFQFLDPVVWGNVEDVNALLYASPQCTGITYLQGVTPVTLEAGNASGASAFHYYGPVEGPGGSAMFDESFEWASSLVISETEATYTYQITGDLSESYDLIGDTRVGTGYLGFEFKWKLTNPYTSSDLYDDLKALLALWDLQNRIQLPFRMDGYLAAAPLVGRDEYPARDPDLMPTVGPSGAGGLACLQNDGSGLVPWWDVATQTSASGVTTDWYSGRVRGGPFAPPSSTGWPDWGWQWDHEMWYRCANLPDTTLVQYIHSFGARNWTAYDTGDATDACIPPVSDWWQNNKKAGELRPHAWLLFDGVCLRGQKSAEVLEAGRLRHNYFRPCGADRWRMDTATAHCVTSYFGGRSDPILFAGDITGEWADGDLIVFYGAHTPPPGESFAWQVVPIVSRYFDGGSTQVVFGTALDIPTSYIEAVDADWFNDPSNIYQYGNPDQGMGGKLRWQENVGGVRKPWQRAVCGSVTVLLASNASPIVVTLGGETDLVNGDQVSVSGCAGNTAANGNWTVGGLLSRTSFALVGSTGNGVYVVGSGSLTSKSGVGSLSDGLPDVAWNSTAHTGDYVYQQWPTVSETGALAASATDKQKRLTGACPVICITPNGDGPSGQYEPFPGTVDLTTCGLEWAARYVQTVDEPIFQTPASCEGAWTGCPEQVEARFAYEAGAPSGYPFLPFPIDDSPPVSAGWVDGAGPMHVVEQVTAWHPCEEPIAPSGGP